MEQVFLVPKTRAKPYWKYYVSLNSSIVVVRMRLEAVIDLRWRMRRRCCRFSFVGPLWWCCCCWCYWGTCCRCGCAIDWCRCGCDCYIDHWWCCFGCTIVHCCSCCCNCCCRSCRRISSMRMWPLRWRECDCQSVFIVKRCRRWTDETV